MHTTHGATPFPRDDYICYDLNALSPHTIALGTSKDTIDLRSGADLLAPIERVARCVHALRVEIAHDGGNAVHGVYLRRLLRCRWRVAVHVEGTHPVPRIRVHVV
jgi:hypothetical protein